MLHLRFVSLAAWPLVALFACSEVEPPLGHAAAGQGGAGGSSAGVGGTTGETGGTGEAGAPGTGGTGGRPSSECYSPSNPEPALLADGEGCACGAADEEQCVRTVDANGQDHLLAFACHEGRWASVEDGACDVPRGCLVDDRLYPENSSIPSPYDDCNTCGCDLALGGGGCTEIGCPQRTCPTDTAPGSTCFECGPAGGCRILEFGCVPACDDDRDCDFGNCDNGICQNVCI